MLLSSKEALRFLKKNFQGRCLNIGTGTGTSLEWILKSDKVTEAWTMDYHAKFQNPKIKDKRIKIVQYCPLTLEKFDWVFVDDFSNRVRAMVHHYENGANVVVDDWNFSLSTMGIFGKIEIISNVEIFNDFAVLRHDR